MVTKEEIKKIAELSKLSLSEQEAEMLTKDLTEIIQFADTIGEAVSSTEDFINNNGLENVYREDVVTKSCPNDEILQNHKDGVNGFYYLKKENLP